MPRAINAAASLSASSLRRSRLRRGRRRPRGRRCGSRARRGGALPYPLKARRVNNYGCPGTVSQVTPKGIRKYGRVRTDDRQHSVGASKVMHLPGTALYNPWLVVGAICRCPKFCNAHLLRDASILQRVFPFQPAVVEDESEHSWAKHRISVVLCYIDNISHICPDKLLSNFTDVHTNKMQLYDRDFVIKM